ncbi:MAG: ribbon-helix-helix protein, CopG family [Actinomycetota bacterium]
MARFKTTLLVEEDLLRRVRVKAARMGRSQSDVLEEALRQGLDPLERIRAKASLEEKPAAQAAGEALEEVRKARRTPRRK